MSHDANTNAAQYAVQFPLYIFFFVYFAQTFFSIAYINDNEFQVLSSSVQNG